KNERDNLTDSFPSSDSNILCDKMVDIRTRSVQRDIVRKFDSFCRSSTEDFSAAATGAPVFASIRRVLTDLEGGPIGPLAPSFQLPPHIVDASKKFSFLNAVRSSEPVTTVMTLLTMIHNRNRLTFADLFRHIFAVIDVILNRQPLGRVDCHNSPAT